MENLDIVKMLQGEWESDDHIAHLLVNGHDMTAQIEGKAVESSYDVRWNSTIRKWQINAPDYLWYLAFIAQLSDDSLVIFNCDSPVGTPITMDHHTHEIINPAVVHRFRKVE